MKKEYLLAAYTIFCWGTLPAVTKLSLTSISNMQVLFLSSLIATVVLLLFLFLSGRISLIQNLNRIDLLQLICLGFLGNFLYSALYYAGVRTLSSADASVINYLWPIIATICATIVLHERIDIRGWLAIFISFIGVVIISSGENGTNVKDLQGVLFCASGAVCYGIFNVFNKKKGLDQFLCTTIYFATTAVCSGFVFFLTDHFLPMTLQTWCGMLWLGIIIDAIAILTWGLAMLNSDVSFLSNFAYTTPIFAMLISYFMLNEPIEVYSILGMIFVIGGCLLQTLSRKKSG